MQLPDDLEQLAEWPEAILDPLLWIWSSIEAMPRRLPELGVQKMLSDPHASPIGAQTSGMQIHG